MMDPLKNISAAVGEVKKNNLSKSVDSYSKEKPTKQRAESEVKVKADEAFISDNARQMLDIRDKAFELFEKMNGRAIQVDPNRLEEIRSNIVNEVYRDKEYTELLAEKISSYLNSGDLSER